MDSEPEMGLRRDEKGLHGLSRISGQPGRVS